MCVCVFFFIVLLKPQHSNSIDYYPLCIIIIILLYLISSECEQLTIVRDALEMRNEKPLAYYFSDYRIVVIVVTKIRLMAKHCDY